MRKVISGICAAAIMTVFATSAMAQKPARGKPAKSKAPAEKSYDFSADVIDGELARPDGENMDVRGFEKHSSLIRIRTDFIREIVKSAEDL